MVRYILLGLLRSGAARHGYALMKEYRSRSGSRVLGGRFYREIRRLVGEGLVCPTAKAPGADARRLPYEITAAGAAEFDSWLANVGVAGGRLDDELYALAAIVGEAVPSSGAAALRRWHEELCIRRAQIEEARQATSTERARHPTALDPLPLILDHRLRRVTADVEFLEKLRAEYAKSAGQGCHQAGCRSSGSR